MTRAGVVGIAMALALGMGAASVGAAAQGFGDPEAGKAKAAVCSACHGADGNGNSASPIWPKLAGQGVPYQMRQVEAIRGGAGHGRDNPNAATMVPMVANMSDEDLLDIAAFYATLTPSAEVADAELAEAGRMLYQAGDAARGIPSCMSCHGPSGRGNRLAAFPALGGQYAVYTVGQLNAYRDGSRTTDPGTMMRTIASRLSDADIKAVAEYISGLHAAPGQ